MHTCTVLSPICILFVFVLVVPTGYPQDFSIEVLSSRSAVLSWIPPLIEEQNGIIISYTVRVVAVESGADFQVLSASTGVRIDTLEPNTMYDFSVAAMTSVGRGPFTSIVNITTPQEGNIYAASFHGFLQFL